MPELPEVEIIKLGLEKKIIGLKIQKIQVLSPKSFNGNPKEAEGQNVLRIWRRAKILGVELSSSLRDHEVAKQSSQSVKDRHVVPQSGTSRDDEGLTLLIHLKMSGQLIWEGNRQQVTGNSKASLTLCDKFIGGHPTPDMVGKMPNPHTRVIFDFSDGSHLYFNDQRKFGWIRVVDRQQATGDSALKNLGPEPLEKGFTWEILKQNLLKHKNWAVKVAIMDQSVVAGVGNIYANEACFEARIDPRRKVSELNDEELQKLQQGIVKSLQAGIKYGGSTRVHFVDPEGRKGYFLDYAKVYWKEGYPCQGCPGKVRKITLGGRGTYFCPSCQT